jgi:hypothetical protein
VINGTLAAFATVSVVMAVGCGSSKPHGYFDMTTLAAGTKAELRDSPPHEHDPSTVTCTKTGPVEASCILGFRDQEACEKQPSPTPSKSPPTAIATKPASPTQGASSHDQPRRDDDGSVVDPSRIEARPPSRSPGALALSLRGWRSRNVSTPPCGD